MIRKKYTYTFCGLPGEIFFFDTRSDGNKQFSLLGPTSKLSINNPESCSITSLANSKLFLMVTLSVVIGSKTRTKCLAIL